MNHELFRLMGFDFPGRVEQLEAAIEDNGFEHDEITPLVARLVLIYKQPTSKYKPESWLFKSDDDLQHTQEAIIAKYPELTAAGATEPWAMLPLLAWVERVDLLKDDDDKLGAYNWSYTAKHIAERAIKTYVSNSQMILAAIMCGYLPNYVRQTNCDFKKGWWYEQ